MYCALGSCPFAIQDCSNCSHNTHRVVKLSDEEKKSLSETWDAICRNALLSIDIDKIKNLMLDENVDTIYIDIMYLTEENLDTLKSILPPNFVLNLSFQDIDTDKLDNLDNVISNYVTDLGYSLFGTLLVFTINRK